MKKYITFAKTVIHATLFLYTNYSVRENLIFKQFSLVKTHSII